MGRRSIVVGGSDGWCSEADLDQWLDDHTFHVGDTLVFNSGHYVVEVGQQGYRESSEADAICRPTGNVGLTEAVPKSRYTSVPLHDIAKYLNPGLRLLLLKLQAGIAYQEKVDGAEMPLREGLMA